MHARNAKAQLAQIIETERINLSARGQKMSKIIGGDNDIDGHFFMKFRYPQLFLRLIVDFSLSIAEVSFGAFHFDIGNTRKGDLRSGSKWFLVLSEQLAIFVVAPLIKFELSSGHINRFIIDAKDHRRGFQLNFGILILALLQAGAKAIDSILVAGDAREALANIHFYWIFLLVCQLGL